MATVLSPACRSGVPVLMRVPVFLPEEPTATTGAHLLSWSTRPTETGVIAEATGD
ncbi:hypothetical protein [Nocardiopsis metallicus]|uniref:hypothetical protein n=1 Tax=Nocardiopsis metallicus TaxID=179819 RepID=UPI001C841681|nr:hypothetical protein [Nocardiopsis metallicus]